MCACLCVWYMCVRVCVSKGMSVCVCGCVSSWVCVFVFACVLVYLCVRARP